MTAIGAGGYISPYDDGRLGVHSLDRFVLQVPDLKVAQAFYSAFGLDVRERGDALDLRTFGNDHVWGTVVPGDCKRTRHLSFGAFAEDLPRFQQRLESLGVKLLDSPPGFEGNGLWFTGFDGVLIEIKAASKSSPDAKQHATHVSVPASVRGAGLGQSAASGVRPSRLAHCLVFTTDPVAATAYYERVLGLKLSDHAGGVVAFMHGVHGSDHHLLAFAKSSAPGFHHCSWDVGAIEEIGRGAFHMAAKGFQKGWGLGRHTIGSNYFHYVQDPWSSFCEYSCDIDYIPAGNRWDTRDFPLEDALVLWGPAPPPDFVHNYEAANA
jgi:catechol 2,3-dioxygenase